MALYCTCLFTPRASLSVYWSLANSVYQGKRMWLSPWAPASETAAPTPPASVLLCCRADGYFHVVLYAARDGATPHSFVPPLLGASAPRLRAMSHRGGDVLYVLEKWRWDERPFGGRVSQGGGEDDAPSAKQAPPV
jgi:hypothetical protein